MNAWLITIPLISAFIGYFTNWIAIKMLFHPRQPIKVLGMSFQGIFPKRQEQFGEKLAKLVSEQFLSFADIEARIADPSNLDKILPIVDKHMDVFLHAKLPKAFPMISMFIGEKTIGTLKAAFMAELQELFPQLMQNYVGLLKTELDLEHLVKEKVTSFSSDKLETFLYQIMSKEFRSIGILTGILGFLIGLVQVGIMLLVK